MITLINKTVRIGRIECYEGRRASVFCKIEYKDGKLSISGVVGPTREGNAIGGCGQIDMEFEHRNPDHNDKRITNLIRTSDFEFAENWDVEKWFDFLETWKLYHLNDLQAGCEHQRALGWDNYDEHPSEPCPTCGYKYGSAWNRLEVPQKALEQLIELPDTDIQPAWC